MCYFAPNFFLYSLINKGLRLSTFVQLGQFSCNCENIITISNYFTKSQSFFYRIEAMCFCFFSLFQNDPLFYLYYERQLFFFVSKTVAHCVSFFFSRIVSLFENDPLQQKTKSYRTRCISPKAFRLKRNIQIQIVCLRNQELFY